MEIDVKTYIGIDGGATKTALVASGADRKIIAEIETSGSSWREIGFENVAGLIADTINKLGCDSICGIAAGMPYYGESTEGDLVLVNELKKALPGIPLYITNDVEVGWAGAFSLKPGIHQVAGTGSIAYGVDSHGTSVRCGGWDYFYSDEGSAYWIARRGMELFSKQSDGRLPDGPLLHIVREEYNLKNDIDFIDYLIKHYGTDRKGRAAFQLMVKKAALEGDYDACNIYIDAAEELFLMANSVRLQLDLPASGWKVSYSGGVFKSGELILDPLRTLVEASGGILCEPENSPVVGALLLAIDKFS